MTQILTISGSLRRDSINTRLLETIALSAPANVEVRSCRILGSLPLFNPDLEGSEPESVHEFRAQIAAASGVVIASPEYAHGITGVLKNALDWVVGSGEFVGKPVAVLNAAPRSSVAYEALKEVLRTIDAVIVPEASVDIPLLGNNDVPEKLLEDAFFSPLIRGILPVLLQHG